jgi:hypothetical protein
MAAVRAAGLGARTTHVTSDTFGGMAANEGPVPVRTLAHAARLLRDARQHWLLLGCSKSFPATEVLLAQTLRPTSCSPFLSAKALTAVPRENRTWLSWLVQLDLGDLFLI